MSPALSSRPAVGVLTNFRGKHVTVMGLGHFGGGAGVARWLVAQGAHIVITDRASSEQLHDSIAAISDIVSDGSVALHLGGHTLADFQNCDLVIANPAIPKPWENECLRAADDAGVPITTEIQLVVERLNRDRTIGVTGSAGKSTTSAMIHHVLRRAGVRAHLGGNIGGSLLNSDQIHADDWIVLELSSAMLHWLGGGGGASGSPARRGWSPHIAAITNITPNHIDWHGSFEHYRESKHNIVRHQTNGDHRVTGDTLAPNLPHLQLSVPGHHNQLNAHLALAVVEHAINRSAHQSAELLRDFTGLPHRLQLIAQHGQLRFYNDSKSTTPEATLLAVAAFDEPARIHLIAGGYDKGSDLSPIAALSERLAGLYTIGATGPKLASAARGFAQYCETLQNAVHRARSRMKTSDILLLSPGCASWDQFTNFEQRGELFTQLVMEG